MDCIDWWMAQEFCLWDGRRLPTEAEREYASGGRAVSGLTPGRAYSWVEAAPSACAPDLTLDPRLEQMTIGRDRRILYPGPSGRDGSYALGPPKGLCVAVDAGPVSYTHLTLPTNREV